MPTSIAFAVAGSMIGEAVAGAVFAEAILGGAMTGSTLGLIGSGIGFAANQVLSQAIGPMFSDSTDAPAVSSSPSAPSGSAAPQFEQELRDNLVTVRQPITHWQYIYGRARVGGAITFAHQSADGKLHLVVTFAGHVCDSIESIWFGDEAFTLDAAGSPVLGPYSLGQTRIRTSMGDEAGQPFPELVAESEGKWTDAHRQTGRTKIYVRLTFDADVFPQGIPNITAIIKGKKVYDPRSALTVWSNNASLCIADLLCDDVWLACTYADEIDETQLIAAANIDDENVSLAGGGTEDRYTLNGCFSVNSDSRGILSRMLTANAGRVHYIGGVFRIVPAAYVSPTLTFTEDHLRGVPRIEPRLSATDSCNGVKGVYVSEANLWQPSDFPPVTNATYLAEDEGERSWRELDLPFTKSTATAQRIAKIELERARQQISVVWPGKFTCYRAQPGDVQQFTFTMLGWSAKAFEVVGGGLTLDTDADGQPILGSDLALRETASSVFDWNSGEETTVDAAPDTNLPDPWTVSAPGTPSITETQYATTGSAGTKTSVTVSWGASADLFVQSGGDYELEYLLYAGSTQRTTLRASATSVTLQDVPAGAATFRVRGINSLGVASAWSATLAYEVRGLNVAPSDIAGFAVQGYSGQAKFTWTKVSPTLPTDLAVLLGGRIFVRWSPQTVGAAWEQGTLVNPDGYPGDTSIGFGPLQTGTYLAKAWNGKTYSVNAASFVVTETLLVTLSSLAVVTESPTFTGTKTNVFVDGGNLQLGGVTNWDSMPGNIDDWGYLDYAGGVATTGSYAFASRMDLGSVKDCRLFTNLDSTAFDTGDNWDDRTNNIDDWGLVDGGTIEDAEAKLMVRKTNDDPASGGATWGSWHALGLVGDYNARGFEFRLDFTSGSVTHNRRVSTLAVTAKQ